MGGRLALHLRRGARATATARKRGGRAGEIRTRGLLVPNRTQMPTELEPDLKAWVAIGRKSLDPSPA